MATMATEALVDQAHFCAAFGSLTEQNSSDLAYLASSIVRSFHQWGLADHTPTYAGSKRSLGLLPSSHLVVSNIKRFSRELNQFSTCTVQLVSCGELEHCFYAYFLHKSYQVTTFIIA